MGSEKERDARAHGDAEAGGKTRQKGGGSVRALCHDACPCTCARPMPTHFGYAPCSVAGADIKVINACYGVSTRMRSSRSLPLHSDIKKHKRDIRLCLTFLAVFFRVKMLIL